MPRPLVWLILWLAHNLFKQSTYYSMSSTWLVPPVSPNLLLPSSPPQRISQRPSHYLPWVSHFFFTSLNISQNPLSSCQCPTFCFLPQLISYRLFNWQVLLLRHSRHMNVCLINIHVKDKGVLLKQLSFLKIDSFSSPTSLKVKT